MHPRPTALILAGGLGSRLASIHPDLPKPLVPVAGQPFLYWLVSWLRFQGFSDFVFSTGYKGSQIEEWLEQTPLLYDSEWQSYREETPLGTGGAVRACLDLCGETLAVVNGDSLILASLKPAFQMMQGQQTQAVILGKEVADVQRYGALVADADGFLSKFSSKQSGPGTVSAGITFLHRSLLADIPPGSVLSMENDIMPQLINNGARIKLFETAEDTPFIDIGTPESLSLATEFVETCLKPELEKTSFAA